VKASALTKVASSNIDAIAHEGQTLIVRFTSGAAYSYEGVPRSVYEELLNAPSVGRYFGSMIRPNYQGTRIELETEES
jgi:hypothetical protein